MLGWEDEYRLILREEHFRVENDNGYMFDEKRCKVSLEVPSGRNPRTYGDECRLTRKDRSAIGFV